MGGDFQRREICRAYATEIRMMLGQVVSPPFSISLSLKWNYLPWLPSPRDAVRINEVKFMLM